MDSMVVSNLPLCFLLQTPYFQGLHHFFKRKSNDLPFLCKYYYQPTNTERKIIAYGYYSLFTLFDSVSLPAKLLADQLHMQIHPPQAVGL